MHTALINELIAEARIHPEIFFVVGDLGLTVVEQFAQEFSSRYLNAGIAEQNMAGVVSGLAAEGWFLDVSSGLTFKIRCLRRPMAPSNREFPLL
jgi:transketolase